MDTFIPLSELEKKDLFLGEFPVSTVTADSHDSHFAVNSRAVALMMDEFTRRVCTRASGTVKGVLLLTRVAGAGACGGR